MTDETNNLADIISAYQAKGYHISLIGQLKSGKEATVYTVRDSDKVFALKVYADPEHRDFSDNKAYLAGKWYRKASVRKAVSQGNSFAKAFLRKSWVRHEFYLLQKLFNAGTAVPRVYDWTTGSILMEFIGDDFVSAPRLIDVILTRAQAATALEILLINIDTMLESGVVHGDLSAYNILW